jgi:hypothetical protein
VRWGGLILVWLALAPAAGAAYSPSVSLTVPAEGGPGSPAAVSAVVTQPANDDPTRTIEARLPGTFGFNSAFVSAGCSAADEAKSACPDSARIGSIAVSSPFGEATGSVFLTEDFRLLVMVNAYGGLVRFTSEGLMQVLPGQEIIVRFDNLPALPVTRMALAMDGGARTPLALPRDCGTSEIAAVLTSHGGEVRESVHPVVVSGCRDLPRVGRVRVRGRVVSWGRDGLTEVRLLRRSGAVWRSVWVRRVVSDHVRLGRLRAGRYRVELVAVDDDGRRSLVRRVKVNG